MKKLLFALLMIASVAVNAQVPTDSVTLRTRVNQWIVPNGNKQISATQLQNILNGILNQYKPYAIDSVYISGDSLKFARRGGYTTFAVRIKETLEMVLTNGNTGTLPIRLSSGAAATPSYSFSLATTTGMYQIGGTAVGLAAGGVSALEIGSLEAVLGSWAGASSPYVIQPQTAAGGADRGGTALNIKSGASTGNVGGGNISFMISPAGSSGSSVNAQTAVATLSNSGMVLNRGTLTLTNYPNSVSEDSVLVTSLTGVVKQKAISSLVSATIANNGLTKTVDSIQLGGTLTKATTINGGTFTLTATSSATGFGTLSVANTGSGTGLQVTSGSNNSITAASTSATGIVASGLLGGHFTATTSGTTDIQPMIIATRTSSGTAANGLGGTIDMYVESSTGAVPAATKIKTYWSNATHASRTSVFEIENTNNAVAQTVLSLNGVGQLKLGEYGSGTHTGTAAYTLATTATGEIIEIAGGASYTFTNGLGSVGTDSIGFIGGTTYIDTATNINFETNGGDTYTSLEMLNNSIGISYYNYVSSGDVRDVQILFSGQNKTSTDGSIYNEVAVMEAADFENSVSHQIAVWPNRIEIGNKRNVSDNDTSYIYMKGGNVEITDTARGVIMRSPDGTRYLLKIANGGTVSVVAAP
jgi:hypothetical protein